MPPLASNLDAFLLATRVEPVNHFTPHRLPALNKSRRSARNQTDIPHKTTIYDMVQQFQDQTQRMLNEAEEQEEQREVYTHVRKGSALLVRSLRRQSISASIIQNNFRYFMQTRSQQIIRERQKRQESAVILQMIARCRFAKKELARKKEEKEKGQAAWISVRSNLAAVLALEHKKARRKRMTAFQRAQGQHHMSMARRNSMVMLPPGAGGGSVGGTPRGSVGPADSDSSPHRVQEEQCGEEDLAHLNVVGAKSLSLGGRQAGRVAHITVYGGECKLIVHVKFYTGSRAQYKYMIFEEDWKATGLGSLSGMDEVQVQTLCKIIFDDAQGISTKGLKKG